MGSRKTSPCIHSWYFYGDECHLGLTTVTGFQYDQPEHVQVYAPGCECT